MTPGFKAEIFKIYPAHGAGLENKDMDAYIAIDRQMNVCSKG